MYSDVLEIIWTVSSTTQQRIVERILRFRNPATTNNKSHQIRQRKHDRREYLRVDGILQLLHRGFLFSDVLGHHRRGNLGAPGVARGSPLQKALGRTRGRCRQTAILQSLLVGHLE
jgi:hypothetical protein